MADKIDLLEQLKKRVSELQFGEEVPRDAWQRRAEMIITNLFGTDSKYLSDLAAISFYPMVYPTSDDSKRAAWERGKTRSANLVNTMMEELKLFGSDVQDTEEKSASSMRSGTKLFGSDRSTQEKVDSGSPQIFIVHGHDDGMKEGVARVVERLGLFPIILHEQPNKGRTVIKKFTDYSEVNFAIVLLSPDDLGKARNEPSEMLRSRARQNVVFELGYFIGKLGPDRVIALYREDPDFEMPSDYSGVTFVLYDSVGRWQFDLLKELKAARYDVDANKLL
jgi:predicted nucleotide-binding protein